MQDIFRVAVLQQKSVPRAYDLNTQTILEVMEQASEKGADILLLPEAFLSGYELAISKNEALTDDSVYIQLLSKKCQDLALGLVLTTFTQGAEKAQNSAFLVSKKGDILYKYSKVHTCDFADEACLESGDEFYVGDFEGVKIGLMICYDREYPESARVLMLKGAELILVPNDCTTMRPRLQALSTRAYENMLAVVMANPPGKNAGNSCAYSPICWGDDEQCVDNTIFLADEQTCGLYFADIDLLKLRSYRKSEMLGNTYRKINAYAKLLDNEVAEPFIRDNQRDSLF